MTEPFPRAGSDGAEPSALAPRWAQAIPVLPLLVALAAAVVAAWPALRSPFYADDYVYLAAARNLSFADYARAALTPWSDEPLLAPATQDFWRPLSYLAFGLLEPLFGSRTTAYHLLVLGIHFSSVVLVWLLTKQLAGRWEAAGIAAVLFAAHPAAFEGVAWISSLSNAGLPLMLGAWLVFARATVREHVRWRGVVLSAVLLALALGFRESTVAVVPAIVFWRCAWWRRGRLGEWSTFAPFVPFAVVFAVYGLLLTRFLTQAPVNSETWELGRHAPGHFWYFVKVVALPVGEGSTGFAHWAQVVAGTAVVVLLPALLFLRRWLMASMVFAVLVAAVPDAPLTLPVAQREVYFPAAFFAIGFAVILRELLDHAEIYVHPRLLWGGVAAVAALAVLLGTLAGYQRTRDWVESGPEAQQAWIDELRAAYPALPEGGTLYYANTPTVLAPFEGALLGSSVAFVYPGMSAKRFETADLAAVQASLGPDDRIFVPGAAPGR